MREKMSHGCTGRGSQAVSGHRGIRQEEAWDVEKRRASASPPPPRWVKSLPRKNPGAKKTCKSPEGLSTASNAILRDLAGRSFVG
ncbi:hypothetical protein NDU88_003119 [Pleurodeles waltl]|uniref:Uncharacterized protein n=1 Tax=Pleurodeles waltl TaxID=8319 RepID=A0AAV7T5A4_PLEWA|nr:hypothetical protein NDU88_003119 [Pleurodeles waltl]